MSYCEDDAENQLWALIKARRDHSDAAPGANAPLPKGNALSSLWPLADAMAEILRADPAAEFARADAPTTEGRMWARARLLAAIDGDKTAFHQRLRRRAQRQQTFALLVALILLLAAAALSSFLWRPGRSAAAVSPLLHRPPAACPSPLLQKPGAKSAASDDHC